VSKLNKSYSFLSILISENKMIIYIFSKISAPQKTEAIPVSRLIQFDIRNRRNKATTGS